MDHWLATVKVPGSWDSYSRVIAGAHIQGGATEEGPFLQGAGRTPDEALRALYERVGLAYITVRTAKQIMSTSQPGGKAEDYGEL